MGEQSTTCVCGATIEAKTEEELLTKVQTYGKEFHDMDMTVKEAHEAIRMAAKNKS